MKNHQITSLLEAQLIGMRRAKMLLTELEDSQIDHYQREHDMLVKRIFILNSNNKLDIPDVVGRSEQFCEHIMIVNKDTMNSMICSKGCGHEIK